MHQSIYCRFIIDVLKLNADLCDYVDQLPMDGSAGHAVREAIRNSKLSDTVIFFMDDMVMMQYGATLASSWSTVRTRVTGERILGVNEIVSNTASLSCNSLRKMFTLLEMLAFKIVHIVCEDQSSSFVKEKTTFHHLVTQLEKQGLINATIRGLCRDIYRTRNEFSHTIQSTDNIEYCDEPLALSFGARGAPREEHIERFLIDDIFETSEVLLKVFSPIQLKQIDKDHFEYALKSFVSASI